MGAWQEIVNYTVPSNTTSVVLDSFDTITKDDFVKIVATFVNASAGTMDVSLFANTATNNTNYHRQRILQTGTTVSAASGNDNRIAEVAASQTSFTMAVTKLSENDRFNIFSLDNRRTDGSMEKIILYTTSSGATFTSGINTLTFTGNQTNGIGTGSRIQIYKLDATKVADITVATNTTQVDISSLSIDKDSEYLLVGDWDKGDATNGDAQLHVNDATTATDYYSQQITGNGSTASAGRGNTARIIEVSSGQSSMFYTHIKLSNIGAYTSQTYGIRDYGTSTLRLMNKFVSSTSEAITSITKINFRAEETNGIGAGSRFILYKLYE